MLLMKALNLLGQFYPSRQRQVSCEALRRGIAAARLFLKRSQDDGVDIAGQLMGESCGALLLSLSGWLYVGAALQHHTGLLRILRQDRPHDLSVPGKRALEGMRSGEQLVQENAKRIDVAFGGDRLAADLLRAGIAQPTRIFARLQIAMHNQILMGELHGRADLLKKLQALGQRDL
jgi:hypothetical protein